MAKFVTVKQAVKAYQRYEDYKQARLEWQSHFRNLMGVGDAIIETSKKTKSLKEKVKLVAGFLWDVQCYNECENKSERRKEERIELLERYETLKRESAKIPFYEEQYKNFCKSLLLLNENRSKKDKILSKLFKLILQNSS
jgi:hypothetical protein